MPGYSFLLAIQDTKSVRRLFPRPFSVAGPQFSPEWSTYRGNLPPPNDNDGCFPLRVGSGFLRGRPAYGVWSGKYLTWHINGLELRAVYLAFTHFLPFLTYSHVIIRTDNMGVVSHINHQGGSRSRTLNSFFFGHRTSICPWERFMFQVFWT